MGILADVYLSTAADAVKYDAAPKLFPDRLQYKSFTPLEFSTLWAFMRGVEWDVGMMNEFPCLLVKDGGERLIHGLPTAMVQSLSSLTPNQIAVLATKWAATDELACQPSDIQPFLTELVRLAQMASATGRSIYLWNCV